MAAVLDKSAKLGTLAIGGLFVSVAATLLSAGVASADNDPSMTEVSAPGVVTSRQSASVAGPGHCDVSSGTLSTSDVRDTDHGTPMQRADEVGPDWVGSDGWQAIGLSRSNPWGGAFSSAGTSTGLQCHDGNASGWG